MERRPPVKISILEKDESEVSHCWKFCQLFSYILVVISGIATCLAMGNIQRMFKDECILYADLSVSLTNNWTIVVTPHTASRWGTAGHCSFCQFCPVASVIFAGIWGIIFVICGRGGASTRNLPQPWRIIPPAILFNFIFLALSCVSLALTFGGFSAFCASIAPQVNVTSCEDLIGFNWARFPEATNFYDDLVISQTGAAVGFIGWSMGCVILLIRVITHADFRVIGPDRKASGSPSTNTDSLQNVATALTSTSNSSSNSSQNCNSLTSPLSVSRPRLEGEPLITRSNVAQPTVHTRRGSASRSRSGSASGPRKK